MRSLLEKECHPTAEKVFELADREFLPRVGKGPQAQAQASAALRNLIAPVFRRHRKAILELGRKLTDDIVERQAHASEAVAFWSSFLLVSSFAGVALGGLFGWWTHSSIIRGNSQMLRRVTEMASGASDLTARIPVESRDEMGQLAEGINAMIAKIQTRRRQGARGEPPAALDRVADRGHGPAAGHDGAGAEQFHGRGRRRRPRDLGDQQGALRAP